MEAKPHLAALIAMNVNASGSTVLHVNANGHASKKDGQVMYGNCSVEIKPLAGKLI